METGFKGVDPLSHSIKTFFKVGFDTSSLSRIASGQSRGLGYVKLVCEILKASELGREIEVGFMGYRLFATNLVLHIPN